MPTAFSLLVAATGTTSAQSTASLLCGYSLDGDSMIQHLLRIPTPWNLVVHVGCIVLLALLNEACVLLFRFRLPFWTQRTTQVFVALHVTCVFVRDDAMLLPNLAFIAWCLFEKHLPPWDDFKKKLGSKLSALTDVVKSSLKRQQAEAFS